MTDTRKPVESLLTDYDIFEPSFVANPYPGYSEIRESECPIAHTERYEGSWLPTRYEDVVALAQEYEIFTSRAFWSCLHLLAKPKARTAVLLHLQLPQTHQITIGIVV
jgi:hypothetical protein